VASCRPVQTRTRAGSACLHLLILRRPAIQTAELFCRNSDLGLSTRVRNRFRSDLSAPSERFGCWSRVKSAIDSDLISAKAGCRRKYTRRIPPASGMFVDYAGQTFDLIDGGTDEIQPAQIFVSVLGASSYTPAFAGAGSMPRRAGRRRCRTGPARMSGRSPFMGGVPAQLCPTTPRACPGEGRGRRHPPQPWRPGGME
jgi:hypothetical protein